MASPKPWMHMKSTRRKTPAVPASRMTNQFHGFLPIKQPAATFHQLDMLDLPRSLPDPDTPPIPQPDDPRPARPIFPTEPRPSRGPLINVTTSPDADQPTRNIDSSSSSNQQSESSSSQRREDVAGEKETVVINVGGRRFQTLVSTLDRLPNSLLGNASRRSPYYNSSTKEYFFDRNRSCFDPILEFYQSGECLRRPQNVPIQIFVRELCFFDIGEEALQHFLRNEGLLRENNPVPRNPVQKYIWSLFEKPDSCILARLIATINVLIVLLSIANFCIQTLPQYQSQDIYLNGSLYENVDSWGEHNASNPFFLIESICALWFTFDLLIRFLVSPIKLRFFLKWKNVIDVLAIVPYFVDLVLTTTDPHSAGDLTRILFLTTLRILRIIKIFRVFKLGRYSQGLQILAQTMNAARYEVGLMLIVAVIGVIVFSAAVYYAELGERNTQFTSIPAGFWWAIITWTTVGYGDIVPATTAGKIVGSFCALCGIVGLSFMVPVVVAHFQHFFYRAQDLEKLDELFLGTAERKRLNAARSGQRNSQNVHANGTVTFGKVTVVNEVAV